MDATTTNFSDRGAGSIGNSLALVAVTTINPAAAESDNALALVPRFDLEDVIMNDEGQHRKRTFGEIPPIPSFDDSAITLESNWEWGKS